LRDPSIEAAANYQMGICYAQQKNDLATAMVFFDKAEKVDPAYKSQVLYQIGLTYARYRNDLVNGIKYLSQAVAMEPENIHYNEDLGVCLAFSHKPAEAIEYFKKCLKIQPEYQNVIGNICSAYNELGKPDSALLFRNMLIKK
jgi:tetratricopeptide (TPR) repeat protein